MKEIEQPKLTVDDRGKPVSSRQGQYHDGITVELAKRKEGKEVSVRDIARVQYGRVNSYAEQYVRRKVSRAVNILLRAGIPAIPVYEEKGYHRVKGIKVITEFNLKDMRALQNYADGAKKLGQLSQQKEELVMQAMAKLEEEYENQTKEGKVENESEGNDQILPDAQV